MAVKAQVENAERLCQLTDAAYLAEQSGLARMSREAEALRAHLVGLEVGQVQRAKTLATTGPDEALLSGSDPLWEAWVESRRSDLRTELAQLRARMEAQKDRLRVAFGRRQAAEAILGKLKG
ncbi:hypothetical protein [Pelagovum pacificum]|uniref:Flagellar FliJ protein n=1 Tax=Pelagovum pacificum TaxID=2588711 RepID=A0A5C5GJ16_9RHOB|nr:hypothetical protein [Pelagovum pacificum]QQA42976.1 hypothetical protein I8N54_19770 [Pelagovum pacificum]TNY33879.1 hypothetical protein FHY64_11625 [Pelagovum pacificum]